MPDMIRIILVLLYCGNTPMDSLSPRKFFLAELSVGSAFGVAGDV